jgi:hypothetical protein
MTDFKVYTSTIELFKGDVLLGVVDGRLFTKEGTNHIRTTLVVYRIDPTRPGQGPNYCPPGGGVMCVWEKPEYFFYTDNEYQTLHIVLNADGYSLHRVVSKSPKRVGYTKYFDSAGNLIPLNKYYDVIPQNTDSAVIGFKIKRKTKRFKFSVFVREIATGKVSDADPQVGNDPP